MTVCRRNDEYSRKNIRENPQAALVETFQRDWRPKNIDLRFVRSPVEVIEIIAIYPKFQDSCVSSKKNSLKYNRHLLFL